MMLKRRYAPGTYAVGLAEEDDAFELSRLFSDVVGDIPFYTDKARDETLRMFKEKDLAEFIANDCNVVAMGRDSQGVCGFALGTHLTAAFFEESHYLDPADALLLSAFGVRADLRGYAVWDDGRGMSDILIDAIKGNLAGHERIECIMGQNNTHMSHVLERNDFVKGGVLPSDAGVYNRYQYYQPIKQAARKTLN